MENKVTTINIDSNVIFFYDDGDNQIYQYPLDIPIPEAGFDHPEDNIHLSVYINRKTGTIITQRNGRLSSIRIGPKCEHKHLKNPEMCPQGKGNIRPLATCEDCGERLWLKADLDVESYGHNKQ